MKWILHSDVVGLYLSQKDSTSNSSRMILPESHSHTQMCTRGHVFITWIHMGEIFINIETRLWSYLDNRDSDKDGGLSASQLS